MNHSTLYILYIVSPAAVAGSASERIDRDWRHRTEGALECLRGGHDKHNRACVGE